MHYIKYASNACTDENKKPTEICLDVEQLALHYLTVN